MNQPTPPNTPSRTRFKVHAGLHLELNTGAARVTATLSPDEALSLAMVLLYEAGILAARLLGQREANSAEAPSNE